MSQISTSINHSLCELLEQVEYWSGQRKGLLMLWQKVKENMSLSKP